MFSEIAEIALVAARLGQFLQFLKTRVILILNFTRPHAITNTKHRLLNLCKSRIYREFCQDSQSTGSDQGVAGIKFVLTIIYFLLN